MSVDQAVAEQAVKNYFEFLSTKNAAAWVEIFSEDALSYDPVGNPANHVHKEYLKFFELLKFYKELNSEPEEMLFSGNELAVKWRMQVTAINGKQGQALGITVFSFNEAGKISLLKAYWDDKKLMAQLR